jgi:Mce-associated membrane protein
MEDVMSTETEELAPAEAEPVRRPRNSLVVAGIALVVVAMVAAAVFGVLWLTASNGNKSGAVAQSRDAALRAAEQGSINLTTLDYHNVQQGLDRWKQSTTGDLYTQLTQGNLVSTFTKQAQQAKSVTVGKVLDGVLTQLSGDKAQAIVYMQVTVSAAGAKPTTKLVPLQWDLTNVPNQGWKLSGLPSGTSGQ